MKVNDVGGNSLVSTLLSDVLHDEDAIKSRKDGALEVDLLCGVFKVIIAPEYGVGGGKY